MGREADGLMPPKNGGKYEDLEAELARDVRVIQEQQEMTNEAVSQVAIEVSTLTRSMASFQKGQKAFNRRMATRIDDLEEITEDLDGAVISKVEEETSPRKVISRWKTDPLIWAIIALVTIIGIATEEWWRDTRKMAEGQEKRLIVLETTVKDIPAQMQRQDAKIDKILTSIRMNGRRPPPSP